MMNLNLLMKEICEALRLDNESNEKEAYKKYVGCIFAIASNLVEALKAQGGEVVVNQAIVKQVKLAQQCTERVAALITTLDTSTEKPNPPDSPHAPEPVTPKTVPESDSSQPEPKTSLTSDQHVNNVASGSPSRAGMFQLEENQASRFSAPVPALPPENNPHAIVARKSRVLTPMEIASKQNQSLMAAYRARMLRLNRADFSAFNYSLTIQRKMAENIAIAKAQEEELARKMQARNQRLEQETAKRFASPAGMSEEERNQRAVYKNILEYENEANWLKKWREKLAANPEDPVTICQLVQEVLRCSDHPITELLKQYQFKIYQRLFPLVQRRAQNLAQIQVPFPEHMWPSQESVKDIIGPGWEPDKIAAERNNGDRGENSEGCSKIESIAGEVVSGNHTKFPEEIQTQDPPLSASSNEDNANLGESSESSRSNTVPGSEENTSSQNAADAVGSSEVASIGASDIATKSKEAAVEEDMRDKKTRDAAELSWERKQAQLLMKQVNERYSLDAFANADEDDNLDYLFENDEESDAITESMYSSLGYIRSAPDHDPPNSNPEQATPVDEKDNDGLNPAPNRSVSHEFQSPEFPDDQVSSPMYQSLPYSSFTERTAEVEKAKKIAKLSVEACERHLKSICEDIHHYLDKLLVLLTIAYEPLDTPVGKDQCAVSLEEPFFKPLWKTLILLFRVVNTREEQVLACVMTKYASASPGDLKVNKKLWLTEDAGAASTPKDPDKSMSKPYERVIAELRRVGDHYTMLGKLECVVKVCRLICECVDDHYSKAQQGGKKAPSIGADDLLPILCYVVVHSAMPQLASECQAMAEFIQEGYLMGEEGYCLTTLRTALGYVTSLYLET